MADYMFQPVLILDSRRTVTAGSTEALTAALNRGADLKIETLFRHDEHMDVHSPIKDTVREVSEFHETIVIDDRWSAGFMTLRQPAEVPFGFGSRPSLSLFLYNQDGSQSVARPFLDGGPITGQKGENPPNQYTEHTKMNYFSCFDEGTNAPSWNFAYAFDSFRYLVRDRYTELLHHDEEGNVLSGSLDALMDAYSTGTDLKAGITGLCDGMPGGQALKNEVFVHISYGYHYQESQLFVAETQPFVRTAPRIPLAYATDNWDYGWAIPHTDGKVSLLAYNPYSLKPFRKELRCAVRWFAAV